jgi:hypothetical protein
LRNELWYNKVKNLKVENLFNKGLNSNKDVLNSLLLKLLNNFSFINKKVKDTNNISLLDFILSSLKHKDMSGVRLEVKGRLTRRLTASRSIFKIKWKGGIRNIDSSYRGISTVMLRGHDKSNVQYSIISSKTRNGAFGIKGWVGSK